MNYKKEIIKSAGLGEQYYKIIHPSGCTVCLYPMEGFSSTYAIFGVNYGSVDRVFKTEKDKKFIETPQGAAHFLEHKLFENVLEKFAETGANFNAFTNFDRTTYMFYCSQKFEENLEILLNFVQNPCFTDETVEKEKGIIEQEIARNEDDPRYQVYLNGYRAVYHEHPIRDSIAGTAQSISKIDSKLLYRCYDTFYNADNMLLSIAGSFDPDRALEICDKLLKPSSGIKIERSIPKEPYKIKEKTVKSKLVCSVPMFEIIYKFPEMTTEEAQRKYAEYTVMLSLCLGRSSPFYTEMYEQGLLDGSFGTGIGYVRGLFLCSISGDSPNPELLHGKINSELKRLKEYPPDKQRFENIKKSIYGGMLHGYESVDMVANTLFNAEIHGISAFDGIELIKKITYEDTVRALRDMDMENCSISIVEPE